MMWFILGLTIFLFLCAFAIKLHDQLLVHDDERFF
jgi:hypothetical protein